MEFGKLSEAPLSKSYTVALLYLSAAAARTYVPPATDGKGGHSG